MALTPGLLLSDRYRLTHRIAVGGMGEVWAADDTRLARSVAVKILKSELTSDPEFVDRFRSEARITASLNHPGIAAVHDYGEVASIAGGPRDTAFLVMELVTGEPLSAVLSRTSRLSVPRTLDVLEQSGRALQIAHARSLVHRDIKPGNILITPTGQVKITDFGIAKVAHQVPVTRGGMVMGTAQYLSPEQAAGLEAGPASDVYALGIVAFECLAGVRPFNAENPVAVAMAQVRDAPPPLPLDVPPPVAGLVMRMLAKDPTHRFPDGASLARAVAAVRAGTPLGTGGAPASGPTTGAIPVPMAFPIGSSFPSGAPAYGVQSSAGPGPSPGFSNNGPVLPTSGPGFSNNGPGFSSGGPPTGSVFPTSPPATAQHNRRTGLAVLVALLVVLIVVVTGYIVIRSSDGGTTTPNGPADTGVTTGQPASIGQTAGTTQTTGTTPTTSVESPSARPDSSTSEPSPTVKSGPAGVGTKSAAPGSAPAGSGGTGYPSRPGQTVPSIPHISVPPTTDHAPGTGGQAGPGTGGLAPGTITDPFGSRPQPGGHFAPPTLTLLALGAPVDQQQSDDAG